MKFHILENKYNINIDSLMSIGYRENNSKRNFLFISKCLGKHLIVNPEIINLTGLLLTYEIFGKEMFCWNIEELVSLLEHPYPKMKETESYKKASHDLHKINNSIVIGFAETATAIGMPISKAIGGYYVNTSREPITSIKSCLNFEETHSHATSHQCFLRDISYLKDAETVILVDDEITTGNTMLHLIESLERNLPNKKRKYIIASILDWRSLEDRLKFKKFSEENHIDISCISLISGTFIIEDFTIFPKQECEIITETTSIIPIESSFMFHYERTSYGKERYLSNTGRFGTNNFDRIETDCKSASEFISSTLNNEKRILVLGHGENIYIPSRIASYLNADFRTTSRSPIYISNDNNYPIKSKHKFLDKGVEYYFYDKDFIEQYYDKVIFITETNGLNIKLCKNCCVYQL